MLAWLDTRGKPLDLQPTPALEVTPTVVELTSEPELVNAPPAAEETPTFGRRYEDAANTSAGPKSLKVDQSKIDRLMNLIGEMVVSKNALPYLAQRAEEQFGVRELSREIKAQYAVINRIAEEMQDAIKEAAEAVTLNADMWDAAAACAAAPSPCTANSSSSSSHP